MTATGSESDRLPEVYAAMDSARAAFNAGDIDGWLGGNHPGVHSFQGDRFIGMSDFAAGVAADQVAASEGWDVIWRDGVVEGDSACVWGEVDWPYHLDERRHVLRMACSWYYVKVDGTWKALFSHYTMLNNSRA
jgi:hypothetical protein